MSDVYSCVATGTAVENKAMDLVELDKFNRDQHAVVDDLQLAALLGQSLLEKNKELEEKLGQLQESTEDTLKTNKSLSRQLNETKEALQFANKTCDQLEQRLEALETHNSELQGTCAAKDSTISLKSNLIESLQCHVEALRAEVADLREISSKHKSSTNGIVRDPSPNPLNSSPLSHSRGSPNSFSSNHRVTASYSELQELTDELTLKLHDSSYQRSKLNVEVEKLLAENSRLQECLTKAEGEVVVLQTKLQAVEESIVDETREEVPVSPVQGSSHGNRITSTDSDTQFMTFHTSSSTLHSGTSLFSELNTQYHSLQKQLDSFMSECTCGAALSLESELARGNGCLSSSRTDETKDKRCDAGGKQSRSSLERPLKELFDEVFVTLQQSALVADRLVMENTTQHQHTTVENNS